MVERNVLTNAGEFPPESEQGFWKCETLAFTADNESVWIANGNCELVRWDFKEKKAGRTLVLDWRLVIPGPEKRQLFLWDAVFCMENETVVMSAMDHIMVGIDNQSGETRHARTGDCEGIQYTLCLSRWSLRRSR